MSLPYTSVKGEDVYGFGRYLKVLQRGLTPSPLPSALCAAALLPAANASSFELVFPGVWLSFLAGISLLWEDDQAAGFNVHL